jgi:uncharacterized protein YgbK (DUF1537 family)
MGEYPSGQRGQTVNLLAQLSMVRIRPPPPKAPAVCRCLIFKCIGHGLLTENHKDKKISGKGVIMEKRCASILNEFSPVDENQINAQLDEMLEKLKRKIVVLDDDPTGIQTVHNISVYTSWDEEALSAGFNESSSMFYVLTNSRSFSTDETKKVHTDIANTLCKVSKAASRDYILISRADSTLRGHYPLETETLREVIESQSDKRFHGEVIFPFFMEGGRYTLDNIHYVKEGKELIPAGDTEFARDKSFGYKSSHMGEYVEEKTKGKYKKEDYIYITLSDLRSCNYDIITQKLLSVSGFNKVIVNAVDYIDVKIFVIGYIRSLIAGKEFIFRSAAALPKVLGGVSDVPLLKKDQLIDKRNKNGGIVIIGSHVQKTTKQFEALKDCKVPLEFIEFDQHRVMEPDGLEQEVDRVIKLAEQNIADSKNVVVYTRRDRFDLDTDDKDAQLKVSIRISDAIASVVGKLTVRPNFIIAKGGITSSDIGTKALKVKKAIAMGQVKPGIPVWMTGHESKFPNMPYVIFPGNVGGVETLSEIVSMLS